MSQNQENQISDQELDNISGGQLCDDNPLFATNTVGGAGVKARRGPGHASRTKVQHAVVGIDGGEEGFGTFEEIG
ncbi:MAG TPA: hypothetical protein PKI03_17080 [Pseudomonadota bacterium]|nr:hypothetical protein [Pseudomonadota bacterium]